MTLLNLQIFRQHYLLVFILLVFWSLGTAQAAPNISCSANMNNGSVNLGNITPENADSASISGTLSYSCTNSGDTAGYVSVCLGADGGGHNSDILNPRYMSGPNDSKLAFNMTLLSGETWGDRLLNGKEYQPDPIMIAEHSSFSGSAPIRISLRSGNGNSKAAQGKYSSDFSGNHTALTVVTSTEPFSADCSKIDRGTAGLPFVVEATVTSGCFINATSDINLGSYSAGTPNITGSHNAINVTCPTDMHYNIGLSPSNGNSEGAGIMKGSGGNSDTIPYQLRSGSNGQPWGNTATANDVGNGVAGIGRGVPNSHTVYVTVPKTDVKPDSYSDIVSVTVNY
ncbi:MULTISPECIES: spore coat protein U domain-containing protein [unclassified Psychrobacter]|uniref:Csu type fimbrial protein n=1 Tax=unclassified Psychrobacter TaxID=196806 RepID=UPI0025D248BC|nr:MULTISPECIES: spore coat protein U domain-containing protein [unclassified Psychrobacter]